MPTIFGWRRCDGSRRAMEVKAVSAEEVIGDVRAGSIALWAVLRGCPERLAGDAGLS